MPKPAKASHGVATNEAAPASNQNIHELVRFSKTQTALHPEEVTDRAHQKSQKELNSTSCAGVIWNPNVDVRFQAGNIAQCRQLKQFNFQN
jgi:hypothetical protein